MTSGGSVLGQPYGLGISTAPPLPFFFFFGSSTPVSVYFPYHVATEFLSDRNAIRIAGSASGMINCTLDCVRSWPCHSSRLPYFIFHFFIFFNCEWLVSCDLHRNTPAAITPETSPTEMLIILSTTMMDQRVFPAMYGGYSDLSQILEANDLYMSRSVSPFSIGPIHLCQGGRNVPLSVVQVQSPVRRECAEESSLRPKFGSSSILYLVSGARCIQLIAE